MTIQNTAWKLLVMTCLFGGIHSASHAADTASFEFGSGNETKFVRFGAQWKWENQWWKSNGTHIGGYWDLTISQWRGHHFQGVPGQIQNITSVNHACISLAKR